MRIRFFYTFLQGSVCLRILRDVLFLGSYMVYQYLLASFSSIYASPIVVCRSRCNYNTIQSRDDGDLYNVIPH